MAEEHGATQFSLVRIHKGELAQRSQDLVQRGLQFLRSQDMNDLEQLFVRASTDPSARPAFYRLLLESTLLALTPPDPPLDEQGNYKGGGEPLKLAVLARSDGNFVLIFTSLARLEAFVAQNPVPTATAGDSEPHGHVSTTGAHLFRIASMLGLSAVLNPGWSYTKAFSPEEVSDLATGDVFSPPEYLDIPESSIAIAPPGYIPDGLLEALMSYFREVDIVDAAYFATIAYPGSGPESRLLLALRGHEDLSSVIQQASLIARSIPWKAPPLDIIVLDRPDLFDANFSAKIVPFYQRSDAGM